MNDNLINILQGKWRLERQVKPLIKNTPSSREAESDVVIHQSHELLHCVRNDDSVHGIKEFTINMMGTAELVLLNEFTLGYKESGNYTHQQNEYNFFQTYQFLMQANKLLIIKNDQSILHEFAMPETLDYPVFLAHTHECGRDVYSCQVILHENYFWQMLYDVKGHNKNYSMVTSFTRI